MPTHASQKFSRIAAIILLGMTAALPAAPAAADSVRLLAYVGGTSETTNDGGSDDCDKEFTDSARCSVSSSGSEGGASGSASGTIDALLTYDDDNFIKRFAVSGSFQGRATAPQYDSAYGEGDVSAYVQFEVVTRTLLLIEGSLTASTSGAGKICTSLQVSPSTFVVQAPGSTSCFAGQRKGMLDEEVELGPGTYTLMTKVVGGASIPPGGGSGSGRGTVDLDVRFLTCDNEFTDGSDGIVGTPGDDILCGGEGDDDISGMGGNDRIYGGPGNDAINGGPGNDKIEAGDDDDVDVYGGDGDDVMDGGRGHDGELDGSMVGTFDGGPGSDTLSGGDGVDILDGGDGGDTLYGGPSADFLFGGAGPDDLFGEAGSDTLIGEGQNDDLDGGPGDEVDSGAPNEPSMLGGPGDDVLLGGPGDDFMGGGDGADELRGEDGSDKLRGDDGADYLVGGGRKDVLNGGYGTDTLMAKDGVSDDVLGGPDADEAKVDNSDVVSGVETFL